MIMYVIPHYMRVKVKVKIDHSRENYYSGAGDLLGCIIASEKAIYLGSAKK